MKNKITLGVSSCLLGEKTRYDGAHTRDQFITGALGKWVEFVSVCPEVECGFGVPREPLRLVGDPESPCLISVHTRQDYTPLMFLWARKRMGTLKKEDILGFIFKSKSPSCGIKRVKVYDKNGVAINKGRGLFARVFSEYLPLVPILDEKGTHNPKTFKNFMDKIFVFRRWREFLEKSPSRSALIKFHTQQNFLILSRSPKQFIRMEEVIAAPKNLYLKELIDCYQKLLIESF
ncbi:MAG: DUF523 and DUF1722 domain-containing protein [Thermodesulfobacteriota bacterium]|jgi:uncharacterized protein YbbK (DUF523 family)|nr:MAG: DUF523 and DUF1722 domain-containing protein [Thermodesulfobacteriota bacterium]